MKDERCARPLRNSSQDGDAVKRIPDTPQSRSPACYLAFTDGVFKTREELRFIAIVNS